MVLLLYQLLRVRSPCPRRLDGNVLHGMHHYKVSHGFYIQHAVKRLKANGHIPSYICMYYASRDDTTGEVAPSRLQRLTTDSVALSMAQTLTTLNVYILLHVYIHMHIQYRLYHHSFVSNHHSTVTIVSDSAVFDGMIIGVTVMRWHETTADINPCQQWCSLRLTNGGPLVSYCETCIHLSRPFCKAMTAIPWACSTFSPMNLDGQSVWAPIRD